MYIETSGKGLEALFRRKSFINAAVETDVRDVGRQSRDRKAVCKNKAAET